MQSTRAALRLGAPVQFRDRWQGTLAAFEVDDDWSLLNVVVAHGILRRSEVRLPFSIATAWDDEHLALDCTSRQAFQREIPAAAAPPRPLSSATHLSAAGFKLAGALVERKTRRATHLLLNKGLLGSGRRLVPVQNATLDAGTIKVATEAETLPAYRADRDLEESVWHLLVNYPLLTGDDRRGLGVEVVDAVVHLSGNVRTPQVQERARDVAASVPGVAGVEDGVINDRQLEIDIGRALDGAGLYRQGRIYVRANLGMVAIGGFLGSDGVVQEILRVVESVPGVRKVENRMELRPPRRREAPAGPELPTTPTSTLAEAESSSQG